MGLLNVTALGIQCHNRKLSSVSTLLVHRVDEGSCAAEIADFFAKNKQYTGGKIPYHIIIHKDGTIEQAISLKRVGFAALIANYFSIQIACIGDFRKYPLQTPQRKSLIKVCTDLSNWLGMVNLFGHDELKGTSKDETKECPGRYVYMDNIRDEVSANLHPFRAEFKNEELLKLGYVIDG